MPSTPPLPLCRRRPAPAPDAPRGTARALAALAALLIGGCCGSSTPQMTEGPVEAEQDRLLRERLGRDGGLGQQLCGVPTQGLKNLVFKRPAGTSLLGVIEVEGNTAEGHKEKAAAQGAAGAGGKPAVDPARLLRCAATIQVFWEKKADGGWQVKRLVVQGVTTPGVDKPPSGGHHHHG